MSTPPESNWSASSWPAQFPQISVVLLNVSTVPTRFLFRSHCCGSSPGSPKKKNMVKFPGMRYFLTRKKINHSRRNFPFSVSYA